MPALRIIGVRVKTLYEPLLKKLIFYSDPKYTPGVPAHIVQRGNNREACFFSDDDYQYYLEVLRQGLRRYDVKLHAYCLMTN